MDTPDSWHIHNEFASVTLTVTPFGRGTRLEIRAGRTESAGMIDATVLEALTLLTESQLMDIVAMATMEGRGSVGNDEQPPPH